MINFVLAYLLAFFKIAVPNDATITFDYNQHKRHILFCGTQLLQGRSESNHPYLKAVVIRTGIANRIIFPFRPI